jgi:LuxR family transcriptional regulator, maltose regulon positive regulatory protein
MFRQPEEDMDAPLLATKLYMPPLRPKAVPRPSLIFRLNEGLLQDKGFGRKLTLISAPAGFGKTTLVSQWVVSCGLPVAWLSLDKGDNEPARLLEYLVSAIRTVAPKTGERVLGILRASDAQPPPIESLLTTILNDVNTISDRFVLVLDDYHVIESEPVGRSIGFMVEHLPPQMHLVIATREDPALPLAGLRVNGQLTEVRANDLRFTFTEAAEFLNRVMGLSLRPEDVAALEDRTEGWIAGLQLAAISMQGDRDAAAFIRSFAGSHRFVLDYLLEEVLQRQPESVQNFLLRTSILDRLCGPLCDAVLQDTRGSGQKTLEYLERSNLFIVSLDEERRWYRYHHLFADLLRQRLRQSTAELKADAGKGEAELHERASQWYEDNGLAIEAFQQAASSNDVERAERLIDDKGLSHLFSGRSLLLDWFASLPAAVLDARPSLWVKHASAILGGGQTTGVEEKLQAAEAVLVGKELENKTRDLIGQIAAARATLALTRYEPDAMITHALRALEYLPSGNLYSRFVANWTVAFAHRLRGERAAAGRAFTEALSIARASGNVRGTFLSVLCLGDMDELENRLHQAAENYRHALQLLGDQQPPSASEAYLGLARILYEWDDLDAAREYAEQSLQLARQYDRLIDRLVVGQVFTARLKLARRDVAGSAAVLAEAEQSVRQNSYVHRMPEVAAAQVLTLLRQGNLAAAAALAQTQDLPLSQARVLLAQGDPSTALAVLEPFRRQMETKGWADECLKTIILQAVAVYARGEKDRAVQLLGDALALAEPGGFIRLFVDEGAPMAHLLSEAASSGMQADYVVKLLAAFEAEKRQTEGVPHPSHTSPVQPSGEPLSQRELEVMRLMAQGLSNREIAERLFLALDTIKGHNRIIFGKLQVQRRTEAVARARELGLL